MELQSLKLTTLSHFTILTGETLCFPTPNFWEPAQKKLNMFQAGAGQIHQATGTTFIRVCLQPTNKNSNVRIFSRNPTGYVWRHATYMWIHLSNQQNPWLLRLYIWGWHPTQLCLGLFLKPWNKDPRVKPTRMTHGIRTGTPVSWSRPLLEENMEESAGATLDAYTHTRAAVSQPRKCFFLKNLFWGWQNDIVVTQNRKN